MTEKHDNEPTEHSSDNDYAKKKLYDMHCPIFGKGTSASWAASNDPNYGKYRVVRIRTRRRVRRHSS